MTSLIYIIKHILPWPMYPLGATLLFLLIAFILRFKGPKRLGTVFVYLAGIILFVFSLSWPGLVLLNRLQSEAGTYANPVQLKEAGVKYIVVLSGEPILNRPSVADRWGQGIFRLMEGIRLWREIPNASLVLSGSGYSSADAMAELPLQLGVPKDAMIVKTGVWDTVDEVKAFKPIVGANPFALVTSAYHIPRAMELFRNEGTNPIACPCDFNNTLVWSYKSFIPYEDALVISRIALHEYYGRLFYWIKGLVFRPSLS